MTKYKSDHPIRLQKDKNPAIDISDKIGKLICPKVIKLANDCYRLFFSQEYNNNSSSCVTTIGCAFSEDGEKWRIEKGERLAIESPEGQSRLLSPAIINIENKYRMYFEYRVNKKRTMQSEIRSAVSTDCFHWSLEDGARILSNKSNVGYGTPCPFVKNSGETVLFFHCRTDKTCDIWRTGSKDGLTFNDKHTNIIQQDRLIESYSAYSPNVFHSGEYWHMYYSGWSQAPLKGFILYARSLDGVNWEKWSDPVISPGEQYDKKHCSEPCLVMINGIWKMFYEGCDKDGKWRILSATQK